MAERRRLLIVTFQFPPTAASGSFRMLGFARHLPENGWDVSVVAPPTVPWEPVDPGLGGRVPADTDFHPAPFRLGLAGRLVRPIEPFATWVLRARSVAAKAVNLSRPDAVLTTGPPHQTHMVGLHLKRRFGLPWVADFRDPWMTKDASTPTCGHAGRPGSLRHRWLTRLERTVIRSADAVLSTAPLATETLRRAFPDSAEKFHTLTNGFDPETFADASPASIPGRLKVTHAGEIYAGRDPRPFLDAIRDLLADPGPGRRPTRVCFLGQYAGPGSLEDEIRTRGLQGIVECRGQVPYAEALAEMADSEILLMLDSQGRRVGIPAKLYEYLGAGRPVLALGEPDGDVAWAIREAGIPHRFAPPGDPGAIRLAISELAAEASSPSVAAPSSSRAARRFTRTALAGDLAQILDDCLGFPVPNAAPGLRRETVSS